MELFDKLDEITKRDLVLGNRVVFSDTLSIIPVYKVKIGFINLDSKIKGDLDGGSASVNLTPISIIEIKPQGIKIHSLEQRASVVDAIDRAPDLFSSISKIFDFDKLTPKTDN